MELAIKAVDPRIERTRELLLSAVVALICERGYERLTIQNIIDEAKIGRATFYAHFASKDALMEASVGRLHAWLAHEAALRSDVRLGLSLPFLQHLDSHRKIYQMTVGRRGELTVGRLLRRMLRALIRDDVARAAVTPGDVLQVDLTTEFLVGALWSTIVWWMTNAPSMSAGEVDRAFRQNALRGVTNA